MNKDDVYSEVRDAIRWTNIPPANPDMFAIYAALRAIVMILFYALIERGD